MIDLNGNDVQEGIETVLAVIVVISVVISAIFIIAKGIKAVNGAIAVFVRFFEDWNGRPGRPDDGIEPTHGVLNRLNQGEHERAEVTAVIARVESKVDAISARVEHELTPNHGTSLKDGVNAAVMLSEQALNAVFIMKKQHTEWMAKYQNDLDMNRREWVVVLDGVTKMIPMDPKDQAPFWQEIVSGYASKTLIAQDDNTETA
jgi:hypothetical protein